ELGDIPFAPFGPPLSLSSPAPSLSMSLPLLVLPDIFCASSQKQASEGLGDIPFAPFGPPLSLSSPAPSLSMSLPLLVLPDIFCASSQRQASEVVQDSDVVIFSVKPQIVKDVLLDLRPLLSEKQLLVSVAAGVKLKDLQEWAGHSRFIRVMPNTPAAVGKAASVISLGAAATEEDGELISKLFGAIGKIWIADEKHFDAITGLSGSGPAYIFLAIEALADGGVAAGLPRELALGLASQTVR
ncbi:hypothetical protein RJ640_007450, partial [Escallonia rubra]